MALALVGCATALAVGAANADAARYYQASSVEYDADVWGLYLNPNGWTLSTGDGTSQASPSSRLVEDGHWVNADACADRCATEATGVNRSGQVSGVVAPWDDDFDYAFRLDTTTGVTTTLRPNSEAYAVNGVGQLVGGYRNANGDERAFLWHGSTFKDLGTLGGDQAVATATPSRNVAVGCAQTRTGAWHPFLYKYGNMKDLGLLPGLTQACAYSANRRGQVVGGEAVGPWIGPYTAVGAGACKAWSRSAAGTYTTIKPPGESCVQATHVDLDGVVALQGHPYAATWTKSTGFTRIRSANVPFGDDLRKVLGYPPVMVGVRGSNPHGQLLVLAGSNFDYYTLGALLTPLHIYDENDPALQDGGGWARETVTGAWGGDEDVALSPGATLTLPFTGKTVSVIAPTGPGFGSATITIDGANPTTVTENASSATRQRVFQATFPTAGAHTLRIVADAGFDVDALTTTQH
jgi:probable HAF family extracellular repeat protein